MRTRFGLVIMTAGFMAGCGSSETARVVTVTTEKTVAQAPAATGEFSGVGNRILGPMDFPRGADARWSSSGGIFMLIALDMPQSVVNPQLIVSQGSQGEGYLPPGHYVLKVGAFSDTEWSLNFLKR
jgi:hypothetical protein